MFKRVQKRLRKREREEELGIDGDMKEVLGLQDTDSDESDSSSEEEEGSDVEAQDAADDEEDSQDDGSVILEEEGYAEVLDTESDDNEDLPEISVIEAVKNPVYIVSIQPKVEACILCPGKLLKNQKMSEVHKASKVSLLR